MYLGKDFWLYDTASKQALIKPEDKTVGDRLPPPENSVGMEEGKRSSAEKY